LTLLEKAVNYKILEGLGTISHQQSVKASNEYDSFNKTQKINSDFDKQIRALKKFDKN
jgi:hypothetical protein